jgi:hypothetical protein
MWKILWLFIWSHCYPPNFFVSFPAYFFRSRFQFLPLIFLEPTYWYINCRYAQMKSVVLWLWNCQSRIKFIKQYPWPFISTKIMFSILKQTLSLWGKLCYKNLILAEYPFLSYVNELWTKTGQSHLCPVSTKIHPGGIRSHGPLWSQSVST